MKKTLLVLLTIILWGAVVSAQTVPNGGFENWTASTTGTYAYELPDSWKTTDSASLAFTFGFSHSAEKDTFTHGGDYALKLTGWITSLGTVPAAASNGDIDILTLSIIKGSPDTVRHAKLNGFYSYAPVGGDTCYIIVSLMKWNTATSSRDTIGYGQFTANSATPGPGYAPFTVNLAYNSWTEYPDTMVILLLTSPLAIGSGHAGTILYIDDLSFTGVVGIDEVQSNINSVDLFPSPASSTITIRVDLKKTTPLHFNIYDIRGKHVFSDVLEPNETSVDVSHFPVGNYKFQLMDGSKQVYSSSFMINR